MSGTQPQAQRFNLRVWMSSTMSEARASPLATTCALLALLALAGVVLRLWFISVSPLDPRYSNADDGDYYRRALRFAVTGAYVDDAWLIRPPLHVFFFALWLRLALILGIPQQGVLFVQLAQTALAALMPLIGYDLARRLFGSARAGLLFAGFLALWHPLVEQTTVLFSEHLYLFLFVLHLWLLVRYDQEGRLRDLALAGVALGAAALTRSPALYAGVFVVGWLAVRALTAAQPDVASRWEAVKAAITPAIVVIAACLAIVAPWTVRNYLVYGHLIPVDTLGQINLWLDLDDVARRNEHIETLRRMPQSERHIYALERAREILAADPLRPFRPMWDTFRHIWKAQFIEDYFVKQSFFTRPLRETAPLGLAGDLIWLTFTTAGLAGLAGRMREGVHFRLFFLAWIGYSLLTVLIFHVEPRYLLPLWVMIALYGAGMATARWNGARATPRLALQAAVVATFFGLLLTYRDYPAIISSGVARERAMIAGLSAYQDHDYPAAEQAFRAALAAQPRFIDAQVHLALALAAQQRYDEALALIRRNSSRHAELVFGALLRDTGKTAQAANLLTYIETIAGEDIQRWALTWLHPPPVAILSVGNGLDMGYLTGFSPAENGVAGGFRWLEGQGMIVLPFAESLDDDAVVILSMTGGEAATTTPLTVRIGNGPEQRVEVVRGQWRRYHLLAPAGSVKEQRLVIALRAPTFVPALRDPASDDARALSLRLARVQVRR
ncbi:glycosyltransferase family 39 protein [Roseiflexus castenholzii]|uniref:glycosyltransferase family 39 protein n=1 Tax=Roseiflexus castenholzii TaxID=120962 RepID=UPI003C7E9DE9